MNRPLPSLPSVTLLLMLGACGGGPTTDSAEPPPLADSANVPEPLLVLQGDPARVGAVPDVVALEVLAASGLQVAYTDPEQRERIDPLYVGAEWEHMQSCIGIVAPAPLVVVVGGEIEPLVVTDDVLRDIDGRITASAGAGSDGVAVMQVHEQVFDGSLGNPGFEMRAIMGRHLWLSAQLPERDYPYLCARSAAPDYL